MPTRAPTHTPIDALIDAPIDAPTYRFRPVTADDFVLLDAWHRQPHVVEWWGVRTPCADDPHAIEGLRDARLASWIVELDGAPFAYLQDYDVHGWEGHHFAHLPAGSRGMDQFIGDAAMIGRGHGSALIARRMGELFAAGAPVLAVDPHPGNARAIAAYRKVGFEIAGEPRESEWGPFVPMEATA